MSKIKYTTDQLMGKFDEISTKRKTEILEDALSGMQAYNGQSREDTIIKAMGYTHLASGGWIKGTLHNCPSCNCE